MFHRVVMVDPLNVLGLTGSLVRAGLLTLRPNASSWNCSSWTTRPAKDLLEGESFWTCCRHINTHVCQNQKGEEAEHTIIQKSSWIILYFHL